MRSLASRLGVLFVGVLIGPAACCSDERAGALGADDERYEREFERARRELPAFTAAVVKREARLVRAALGPANCGRCFHVELCKSERLLFPALDHVRRNLCAGPSVPPPPRFDLDDCFEECLKDDPANPFDCEVDCAERFADSLEDEEDEG